MCDSTLAVKSATARFRWLGFVKKNTKSSRSIVFMESARRICVEKRTEHSKRPNIVRDQTYIGDLFFRRLPNPDIIHNTVCRNGKDKFMI